MYTNKEIWNVSYPIFLGLLAQNIINVTDTAFLGRVGEVELGASAMGGLFYICVFTIAFGFSIGSQILIARRNGEGRYKDVGPVMIQGGTFLLGLAVLMFGLTHLLAPSVVRLLISSDSIFDATMEFLNWRIFGFFFAFINVMFRALYIGITRTKVLTMNAVVMALVNVLLHVAFYAKIGSETGDFDIKDVCDCLCEKLIFRHPHVFGEVKAETAEKVTENWEQLKMKEKDGNKMVLSGVPSALPSLIKAYRIQDKARNVGFDWEERSQVWTKVKEEIGEFEAEVENMDKEKAEAEFGDVMFSLINAARLYKINPDNALELTNQKFIRRFNYLEEHTIKQGKNLKDMTLEEMDAIWNEAKKEEK